MLIALFITLTLTLTHTHIMDNKTFKAALARILFNAEVAKIDSLSSDTYRLIATIEKSTATDGSRERLLSSCYSKPSIYKERKHTTVTENAAAEAEAKTEAAAKHSGSITSAS